MYETPRVERFGTFRELTQAGTVGPGDHTVINCNVGNNVCGTPAFPCAPSGRSG